MPVDIQTHQNIVAAVTVTVAVNIAEYNKLEGFNNFSVVDKINRCARSKAVFSRNIFDITTESLDIIIKALSTFFNAVDNTVVFVNYGFGVLFCFDDILNLRNCFRLDNILTYRAGFYSESLGIDRSGSDYFPVAGRMVAKRKLRCGSCRTS